MPEATDAHQLQLEIDQAEEAVRDLKPASPEWTTAVAHLEGLRTRLDSADEEDPDG